MQTKRTVGRDASVRKYDLLTSLALLGLSSGKAESVSMLRLISAITARYNWKADELSVGQADLAKMWSVDLRTVKREMKRLREAELLILKRAGAKGRVSAYSLNQEKIEELSADKWDLVGPDFGERMREQVRAEAVRSQAKVVQFPEAASSGPWGRAQRHLASKDAARFNAWFSKLQLIGSRADEIVLGAPSEYHANYVNTRLLSELHEAFAATGSPMTKVLVEV